MLSSVKNALRLLQSFTLEEPEKKVTDLARSLGLAKSTVSRLLSTLASEGFVTKDPETQKYRLGLSILNLNTVLTSHLEVTRESQKILKELVKEIDETVHISVVEEKHVVYLNRVECSHPVQILSHIGRRNPLHCTSSGKVLLAYQKEEFINQYLESGLVSYTDQTINDPVLLKESLESIREQGFGTSSEELRVGVTSIASPIYDYTGKVNYALSVIGPTHRMNPHNPLLIKKVKQAAADISENLGYWKK
ncbi:MAG TPA: IclR family transcriptional regulator [Chondromyces sp.]|nr:IclR family transcriptional regulator [Chondromyces sp.]